MGSDLLSLWGPYLSFLDVKVLEEFTKTTSDFELLVTEYTNIFCKREFY